jgi:hypothetical protein
MYLKEIGWEGVGWIHVAQDKNNAYTLFNLTSVNDLES